MTPPRTRKTTAADTEEQIPGPVESNEPAEAPEDKAATANTET